MKVTLSEDDIVMACAEWLQRNHGVNVSTNAAEATAGTGDRGGRYTPMYLEVSFEAASGTPPQQNGPYR